MNNLEMEALTTANYIAFAAKHYSNSERNFFHNLHENRQTQWRLDYIADRLPAIEDAAAGLKESIRLGWAACRALHEARPASRHLQAIKLALFEARNILINSQLNKDEKTLALLNSAYLRDTDARLVREPEPEPVMMLGTA
jgi:hypothetical protein